MKNAVHCSLLVFSLMFFSAGSISAEDFQRSSWHGPIGEKGMLRVENPFGDVRLRSGGGSGEVEVAAVLQQLRSDGVPLELQVIEKEGELVVTAHWATKPGIDLAPRPEGDRSRVDIAILVPAGAQVVVDAPNGLVETRGVHGDAKFRTETGDIRIHRHFGAVSASTETGMIEAVLLAGQTDKTQVFESLTGSIEVWVAADANHRVTLSSSGSITTDFSIDVSHHDDSEPDKIGHANLGDGGPEIHITSRRGEVALRRVATAQRSVP